MTKIAVTGAGGRMGRTLIEAIANRDGLTLSVALEQPRSTLLGADAGELAGLGRNGIEVVGDLAEVIEDFDVLIDFTAPAAPAANASLCAGAGRKMVVGTTGFTPEQKAEVLAAAESTALCMASNFSTGVMLKAVPDGASTLCRWWAS